MAINAHELFNDSYERCISDTDFIDKFYSIFFNADPEIKAHFANTNMETQKLALISTLPLIIAANTIPNGLKYIAEKHDANHLNIEPKLYQVWLNSLIKAAEETDPYFKEEIRRAWIDILTPGIEYMIMKHKG